MRPDGALGWGVKAGFREYVQALTDGRITATGGARTDADGFRFALVADERGEGGRRLRFGGGVEFFGYRGVLQVRIRDPWIEYEGDAGLLTIMHPAFRETTDERVAIGALEGVEVASGVLTAAVALHPDGVRAFDEVYPAGARLDPVRVELPAE